MSKTIVEAIRFELEHLTALPATSIVPIKVNPENGFIYDTDGAWYPPLNQKQFEIFSDYHRYLLIHGPRKSGKTFAILQKVIRHAFDVNGAMVAIVTKTIKNAKSAGVWVLLDRMLKMWAQGCHGFTITEGPKTTGDSKMSFVRIRNRHGTISEIQCHSLEHSTEVEAKFKGPAYSMFWLSEFDQYCDEHAFDIFCDALRMWPNVKYEEHQIICDCNPPDTGTNNWIHDKWFKFKDSVLKDDDDKIFQDGLHRILVNLDDNPQLDLRERREIETRYKKRKALFNRFILGLWEQDITDGHFSDVYDESEHVLGNVDCAEEDWEIMVPTPGCTTLIGGWDMGESKNHSFHIMEKIITEHPVTKRQIIAFSVIDEFVVIRTYKSIREFTEICLEKIEHWNNWQLKKYNIKLNWRHWSDTSAFSDRASAEKSDAAITYEASDGQIVLNAAPKYKDSNRDKVKLVWQFLYEKRLHISAQLTATRAMLTNLRSDPHTASHYVKRDDHKHPFDSMSYPIIAEAPSDMMRSAEIGTTTKKEFSGMVISGA